MRKLAIIGVVIYLTIQHDLVGGTNLHPDANLDIIQLATKYGYPIESHKVQTEDGYVLTLHRIPTKRQNLTNPPVLLMHGLLCSSVDWINMGPEAALGLLLSDEGYDVWLGNQRGNTWSRNHIYLDPDQSSEKFYNFSFHEIGIYDLPAKIDYILQTTGHDKLFYIGHSQGTTAFYVMASEKPEYNNKISLMIALAPVAFMENIPNPLIKQIVDNFYDLFNILVDVFKVYEVLPRSDVFTRLGNALCTNESQYQIFCAVFLNIVAGFDWEIDPDFIPVITSNVPAGASMKQIQHYFQEVKSGNFSQYDYGPTGNMARYNQETPLCYNIENINAPVSLYYSGNDWLTSVDDIRKLEDKLPNVVNSTQVPLETFNHLDFLWAQDAAELLYNDIIAEIKYRK